MKLGSAGASRMRISAWLTIFLLVVMSLIFSLTVASAVGTLLGNLSLFWIIGTMAKRQEEAKRRELENLQQQFLQMRQREIERMERYAKLEG